MKKKLILGLILLALILVAARFTLPIILSAPVEQGQTIEAVRMEEVTTEPSGVTQEAEQKQPARESLTESQLPTTPATDASSVLQTTEPEQKTPRIGIAWSGDYAPDAIPKNTQYYIDAVRKAGGEPVLLDQAESEQQARLILKDVDGLIVPGGPDLDPSYYGEKALPGLNNINKARDVSDMSIVRVARELDLPFLGICRGMQVLNVVRGGTLYQDIPTQLPKALPHRDPKLKVFLEHEVQFEPGSVLYSDLGTEKAIVNSWHHQSIKDLGDDLAPIAWTADGVIEAVERPMAGFIVGVQFHPERLLAEGKTEYLALFEEMVHLAKYTRP